MVFCRPREYGASSAIVYVNGNARCSGILNFFFTSVVEFACLPDELAMIRSLNVKAVGPNGIHVESSKVCWRAI